MHGGSATLADISLVGLGLGDTLGEDLGVLVLAEEELLVIKRSGLDISERKLTASSLTFSFWRRLRAAR